MQQPTQDNWQGRLNLQIASKNGKSVVQNSSQNGPLTIQNPFYPEGDTICHIYLLHPPGGVVGGDILDLNVNLIHNGSALLTTPGAAKFYRSAGPRAIQNQNFTIAEQTTLEWLPQETIYFPNANAGLNTTIHLEGNGQYFGWDIHCLGLPVNKEDFGNGTAHIGFNIYRDDMPVIVEKVIIDKTKNEYQSAFLQGKPVFATLTATGGDQNLIDELRDSIAPASRGCWAASLIDDIVIVRYVGSSTSEVRRIFVDCWCRIRPHTLKKEAVLPRIWAT